MTRLSLPYNDCPTCGLHWHLFAPAKIDGKEAVRCVECKAVYPLSAEPGYVVKPLEWRTHKGDDFCDVHYDSDAIGGSYTIEARKNGSFDLWKPNVQAGRYASLDEAKSAAQADYEQRIRSAITATVGTAEPGYVAVRDAFRAGWYVNAIEAGDGEDQQPADYLAGCEEVDWREYKKKAIAALPAPATASAGEEVTVETLAREFRRAMLDNPTDGTFNKRAEARERIADEYAKAFLSAYKITKRSAT